MDDHSSRYGAQRLLQKTEQRHRLLRQMREPPAVLPTTRPEPVRRSSAARLATRPSTCQTYAACRFDQIRPAQPSSSTRVAAHFPRPKLRKDALRVTETARGRLRIHVPDRD